MISSAATLHMAGWSAPYNMAKAALEALALTLAKEERRNGIHVNIVAPGLVDTAMLRDDLDAPLLQALVDQVPLGRLASPAEVAPAVVFLASAHAAYITGATLNISGGWLMY